MHRTEIDGVAVLWEQGPEPLTAALVFGVGARHETFRTVGVTHLIEHLVMGTLPKSALDRNAEVDLDTTVFHATGRPADVVDFVNRVCRAVSELPLDRVERETGVLRAEEGSSEHPAVAASLRARFGFQSLGLAGTTGPGPQSLTRDHVCEHARRFFTRENAYLVLTGEPPAGLELRLPSGPAVAPLSAPAVDLRLPGRISGEHFGLAALSGIVTERDCAGLTAAILRERVEDELRGRHGIAYDIGSGGANIRVGESMPVVWTDGHDDKWQVVVDTLWSTLTSLAEHGPTAEELAHVKEVSVADLEDPRSLPGWLIFQASRALFGRHVRTRAEQIEIDRAVRADSVRLAASQMAATALLLVPAEGVELDGVPDITHDTEEDSAEDSAPVDGRVFRRRLLTLAPRDLALRVGDSGLSITADGSTSRVDWADVVGVASAPGIRGLVAGDGRVLPVVARFFRDSDELLTLIDQLAGPLAFESDPEDILD